MANSAFYLSAILMLTICMHASAQQTQTRWAIDPDGAISWKPVKGEPHQDNIEMSGRFVSVIVTYGVDQAGKATMSRQVVWPMLRFAPNKTHDHLSITFGEDVSPRIFINRAAPRNEVVTNIRHKGLTTISGTFGRQKEVEFSRTVFPSVDKPAVIEKYVLTNRSDKDVMVEAERNERVVRTNPSRSIYGEYIVMSQVIGLGEKTIKAGESATFAVIISARRTDQSQPEIDVDAEQSAREKRVSELLTQLKLETPDNVLNTMFAFAKIRAAESIYETKAGLFHGPGGGAYYAAIWANDQAEYANPFFAYLGDETARESAITAYRQFARYMNPDYKPIPSSIISEGEGFWNGAGDRGDAAMIAYGATRFALANGGKKTAQELWPLIQWCLEFCKRKVNAAGVVASKSDELEGRFPAGDANLCTSSLYHDALRSSAMLAKELDQPQSVVDDYTERATAMHSAIEKHFGAKIEEFETYRYYDGNRTLRAWICIPLTVGIFDRADATVQALFSPKLWTKDGLATEAGKETFWDRSTLYALRGVFAAGATQKALDFLKYYSTRRLLGDHVPYAVEAYPEGNQRHLSAESALYCRIYTEGMFGIRPTGLRSFTMTPRLPKDWPAMKLTSMRAFGGVFDIEVHRAGEKLEVKVSSDGKTIQSQSVVDGDTVNVQM